MFQKPKALYFQSDAFFHFSYFLILIILAAAMASCSAGNKPSTSAKDSTHLPLVLMTDFGEKDGAVSAMRGVAYQVSKDIIISDLTHAIPPYDIWQGAYRLMQTAPYWPSPSVFVTVVDPGVGSDRKSIVAKSKSGHLFVGPDNGHLTLIAEVDPIVEVRQIDESKMRLKGSEESYTFHGRDLYAYVGAQLASQKLLFKDVGEQISKAPFLIKFQKPHFNQETLKGNIPILDPNFGNVWTNLPKKLVHEHFKKAKELDVTIKSGGTVVYQKRLPLVETFAAVKKGEPLLYFNSLLNLSVALNQDNFAKTFNIKSGPDWSIEVKK